MVAEAECICLHIILFLVLMADGVVIGILLVVAVLLLRMNKRTNGNECYDAMEK